MPHAMNSFRNPNNHTNMMTSLSRTQLQSPPVPKPGNRHNINNQRRGFPPKVTNAHEWALQRRSGQQHDERGNCFHCGQGGHGSKNCPQPTTANYLQPRPMKRRADSPLLLHHREYPKFKNNLPTPPQLPVFVR